MKAVETALNSSRGPWRTASSPPERLSVRASLSPIDREIALAVSARSNTSSG